MTRQVQHVMLWCHTHLYQFWGRSLFKLVLNSWYTELPCFKINHCHWEITSNVEDENWRKYVMRLRFFGEAIFQEFSVGTHRSIQKIVPQPFCSGVSRKYLRKYTSSWNGSCQKPNWYSFLRIGHIYYLFCIYQLPSTCSKSKPWLSNFLMTL